MEHINKAIKHVDWSRQANKASNMNKILTNIHIKLLWNQNFINMEGYKYNVCYDRKTNINHYSLVTKAKRDLEEKAPWGLLQKGLWTS